MSKDITIQPRHKKTNNVVSDTNGAIQGHMARGSKLTAKLLCAIAFAYAKCWFSHDAAYSLFYTWLAG